MRNTSQIPLQHVLLAMDLRSSYDRQVIAGVQRYADRQQWLLNVVSREDANMAAVNAHHGHALIGRLGTAELPRGALVHCRVPIVSVARESRFTEVTVDDMAVGAMAAEHLMERGFRNMTLISYGNPNDDRMIGFAKAIGDDCRLLPTFVYGDKADTDRMQAWLAALPRPCGILAIDDNVGAAAITCCRLPRITVPEQVAIVGVGSDPLMCEMSPWKLSSVRLPTEQIGFRAAQLIDTMLRKRSTGGQVPPDAEPVKIRIPPLQVDTRFSSDSLAVADAKVAAALRLLRARALEPIRVEQLVDQLPMSRRQLELGLARYLGHTPWQEVRRQRINHAMRLLAMTDTPIDQIAEQCGYGGREQFCRAFAIEAHQPPARYRRQFRY